MGKILIFVIIGFAIMLFALIAFVYILIPGPDESKIIFSVPFKLPTAIVGNPYAYSFCEPGNARSGSVCGGLTPATNPHGGKPPYSITYGNGLHPTGINLQLNGLFNGTPAIAGTYSFEVCARDGFGTEDCEYVSIEVEKEKIVESINVSPSYVVVRAPLCMSSPCKASTKIIVSSTVPWHVDFASGSATTRCYDPVSEFSRYWSMCPTSGCVGDTEVELSTMVYAESTPNYYDALIQDRGSTWRIESINDYSVYQDLKVVIEYPYYK